MNAGRTIQTTIALAVFSLVFVSILAIEIVSYRLTVNTVVRNSRSYTYQLIDEAGQNIDSYLSYMKNISSVIMYNNGVQSYFENPTQSEASTITDLLGSIKRTRTDVTLIALFGIDGRVVADRPGLSLNPYVDVAGLSWYRNAITAHGNPVVSSSHVEDIVNDEYRWVVSLSREIIDARTGAPIAVLLVDLNFRVIRDICTTIDLGSRGYVFILDADGSIVYHPQQQLIYSSIKSERIGAVMSARDRSFTAGSGKDREIYTVWTSAETGWKLVGVTYMNALVSSTLFVRVYYALSGIACIAVVALLSILVGFRITKPIKMLTLTMQRVEAGDFSIRARLGGRDEIGELGRKFNMMITKIEDLMQQIAREHEAKRRAELEALQAQISPHFLYNTLDSIIWMAEGKRHAEVVKMVSSLSKLLRLSISSASELITVREESEHLLHYLTIQKMRYRDKLDFDMDIDESIMKNRILKTLLQPLAENSIYHGIKNKAGGGMVSIRGERCDGRMRIQIVDNGIGMSDDRVRGLLADPGPESVGDVAPADEALFEVAPARDGRKRRGVGVRNVHERIKLYFGPDYGLTFESAPERGTTVTVWLPLVM